MFDLHGIVQREFFAFDKDNHAGVNIAVEDIDQDGVAEIATAMNSQGPPYIRIYEMNGRFTYSFFAFDKDRPTGLNIGFIKIKSLAR